MWIRDSPVLKKRFSLEIGRANLRKRRNHGPNHPNYDVAELFIDQKNKAMRLLNENKYPIVLP